METLPNELLEEITTFLGFQEIECMSRVSKMFHNLIEEIPVWKTTKEQNIFDKKNSELDWVTWKFWTREMKSKAVPAGKPSFDPRVHNSLLNVSCWIAFIHCYFWTPNWILFYSLHSDEKPCKWRDLIKGLIRRMCLVFALFDVLFIMLGKLFLASSPLVGIEGWPLALSIPFAVSLAALSGVEIEFEDESPLVMTGSLMFLAGYLFSLAEIPTFFKGGHNIFFILILPLVALLVVSLLMLVLLGSTHNFPTRTELNIMRILVMFILSILGIMFYRISIPVISFMVVVCLVYWSLPKSKPMVLHSMLAATWIGSKGFILFYGII